MPTGVSQVKEKSEANQSVCFIERILQTFNPTQECKPVAYLQIFLEKPRMRNFMQNFSLLNVGHLLKNN